MTKEETALSPNDPYADRPTFWQRQRAEVWAVGIFVLTAVLTVVSFPPFNAPEFAYAFAAPAIFWAYLRPSFRLYAGTMLTAQAVAWCVILGWLHHVTWAGLPLLGVVVGAWIGVWYLAVWWAIPLMQPRKPLQRVLVIFGLAGLWVVIEWTRTWLLSGFPWLPLAASQWKRSILLQIASITGAYGVSFILIVFNLGIAAYAHRLLREAKQGLKKRSPEFMTALMVLIFPSFLLLGGMFPQQRADFARIALVQPDVPQTLKWDPAQGKDIAETLEQLTLKAAKDWPDAIFWPEAVTPWAVRGDPYTRDFVASLSARVNTPLVLGSIAIEQHEQPDEAWYNGVFVVTPDGAVADAYYAKRHLVPFGEYVPLRPVLGWIEKFVPIGGDFSPGDDPRPLLLPMQRGLAVIGPLVCFEDIFPQLARASVRMGAELLTVQTNNGWFGEGGAAYQHAAHSVLRAIETRRPVVRVGNSGWSGWIDEYGNVRDTMIDENGSIY
ncbi:MAG: apolipoprotein N-acyltransferase, partial [Opitutaceae bacterium]|nr:apolipoprotein N-acyltransferase [Opitutaceae bacterium]